MFVKIIERLFSVEVKQRMQMFGQYIILRLQKIYHMFKKIDGGLDYKS